MSRLARAIAAALLAGIAAGCGGGDDGPNGPTPEQIAADRSEEGWEFFELGSYPAAAAKFREALATLPTYTEAQSGLGWTLALLDSLGASHDAFGAAISNGHPGPEARAGRAFVSFERQPVAFLDAVNDAAIALALSPRFLFEHDESVDWRDLRLLRAQGLFELSRLTESAAEVDSLGVTPPDPEDPAFADTLLAQIERLGGTLGPPALRSAR